MIRSHVWNADRAGTLMAGFDTDYQLRQVVRMLGRSLLPCGFATSSDRRFRDGPPLRTSRLRGVGAVFVTVVLVCACGDDDDPTNLGDAGVPTDSGSESDAMVSMDAGSLEVGTPDSEPTSRPGDLCPVAQEPPCQDESIEALRLRDVPSDGMILEEGARPGETTLVDATAGGLQATESYVYARFGDGSLEKVELSDEEALESQDWHIAFRRYIIRLNSGVSGPSCVRAARLPDGTVFEEVTAVPDGLELFSEAYMTESCGLVSDGSGLPNAAATVLASYWDYPGCVRMTGNVFAVELPDGRAVKLEVLSYYDPERQEECRTTSQVSTPSGSGNIRLRWEILPQ